MKRRDGRARKAQGDYFFLLNSDAVVTPARLEKRMKIAEALPACGLIGPMFNCARPPQRAETGSLPRRSAQGVVPGDPLLDLNAMQAPLPLDNDCIPAARGLD